MCARFNDILRPTQHLPHLRRTDGAGALPQVQASSLPACDGSRGEYAEDVPSKFRLQIAQDATRATVMQAYRADALCLGYEGIGLGPCPSPS